MHNLTEENPKSHHTYARGILAWDDHIGAIAGNDYRVYLFSAYCNVLRIASGVSSLAYAN